MRNNFNWTGMLCIGASFFAILITLGNSQTAIDNSAVYAIISVSLALLAIPFSFKSIVK